MAYVLRPCGPSRYFYIGDCYLHRVMHGEALDTEDFKDEEFTLL